MGTYINPGNMGFSEIADEQYVDKTGMIELINKSVNTRDRLICVSRPRRFGKSWAAQMLCAYYDCSCDSHSLFDCRNISLAESYEKHINKYNVVYIDMTNIIGKTEKDSFISFVKNAVISELADIFPGAKRGDSIDQTMLNVVEYTGKKFIMIIDEWDAPIREIPEMTRPYLEFLRMLFKSSGTTSKIFAAAYMTGILPIKKDGSQSAISDFNEFTIIKPRMFAPYVGFTEEEVKKLCERNNVSFEDMKRWYDGYTIEKAGSVYNPNSVMKAISFNEFESYWTASSSTDSLREYISMGYDGLDGTIAKLIGGIEVPVDTYGFANDLTTFRGADDVLTLLIHLGYLAYDAEKGTARIPNEEIRREFARTIRFVKKPE